MISQINVFQLLVLVAYSTGYTVINERNDVTCASSTCSSVRYQLYLNETNYQMAIYSRSSCHISACENCTYKSDWSLTKNSGSYYLTRSTSACTAEQTKNFTDIFPTTSYYISDVVCSAYSCSKYRYNYFSTSTADNLLSGLWGSCSSSDCQSCYSANRWSLNSSTSVNMLSRATSNCSAPTSIAMDSFFYMTILTTSTSTIAYTTKLSTVNSEYNNLVVIVGIVVGCGGPLMYSL